MNNLIVLILFFAVPAYATLSNPTIGGIVNSVNGSGSLASTGGVDPTVSCITATSSVAGCLSAANWTTFNGKQSAVSFAAVGSTPNANGGGLSSGVLTLQPADGSHPGLVTAGTQTIGGNKTFSGQILVDSTLADFTNLRLISQGFNYNPPLWISDDGGNALFMVTPAAISSVQVGLPGTGVRLQADLLATSVSDPLNQLGPIIIDLANQTLNDSVAGVIGTWSATGFDVNGNVTAANLKGMPSSFMSFSSGLTTVLTANEILAAGKTVRAMTVENFTGAASVLNTCTVDPVIKLYDCGTSTGTCTSGTTEMATVTLTAANTITNGSVSSANIAAGHYWAFELTAGSCVSIDATGSVEAIMQ